MTMTSMPLDNAVLVVADTKISKEMLAHALIIQVQTVEVTTVAGTTVVRTSAEVTMAEISSQIETVVPVVAETVMVKTMLTKVHASETWKELTVMVMTAAGTLNVHNIVEITIPVASWPASGVVRAVVE